MSVDEQIHTRAQLPRTAPPNPPNPLTLQPDSGIRTASQPEADWPAPTLFHEPWWLEITTHGRFEAAQVHHGGRLIGSMPYLVSRRAGFRVIAMPPLTHLLGPAIDEGKGSSNSRWLRRLDVVKELIAQLPGVHHFSQTCHPGITDVLGFQGAGFESSVQFSAEIQPADADALWRGMRDKTRNVVRRAQERSELQILDDPQEFAHFYRLNLESAGERSYFDLALIARVYEAASARGRAQMLAVTDAQGQNLASALFVWDHRRLWYLLSSRNQAAADNGAVSWLIWQGISEAAKRGLVFDFDGIFSMGSARFFSGFGASIQPRYVVRRQSPNFSVATGIKTWLRGDASHNRFVAS